MDYENLLNKAYQEVKVVVGKSERFEIPKVKGMIQGKSTIITNINEIADYLRRPVEQLIKFLQRELATPARIENGRLIINKKINSGKINDKIEIFSKETVICPECGKPDTEIVSEKGIKLRHCLACGAKSPVKNLV